MLSKEEIKETRIQFFAALEKAFSGVRSSTGKKTNWMSYKTGIKHIYFRFEGQPKYTRICIDLQMPDDDIRKLAFEQFTEMKTLFEATMGKAYIWEESMPHPLTGKTISRVYLDLGKLRIFNHADQQEIINTFKTQAILFDQFWIEMKDVFAGLLK